MSLYTQCLLCGAPIGADSDPIYIARHMYNLHGIPRGRLEQSRQTETKLQTILGKRKRTTRFALDGQMVLETVSIFTPKPEYDDDD